MNPTNQTLLEQMKITEFEITYRKELLLLGEQDSVLLASYRPKIEPHIEAIVDKFYTMQTTNIEIAQLIGDVDSLTRLRATLRSYILDLFSGLYDLEYVHNRLKIGLVHKRARVELKLYLAAANILKGLLIEAIVAQSYNVQEKVVISTALDKIFLFDITLVVDTYIHCLVSEIWLYKEKSETNTRMLEEKVGQRTKKLEEMCKIDGLTGLLNVRYLQEYLTRTLRTCQRRSEPLVISFLDINNFKQLNDNQGHQRGDEILRIVGECIRKASRAEDYCFRYGGDEFCLIMPNCNEEQARNLLLSRLNNELAKHTDDVTLSIGLVQTGPVKYDESSSLIRMADECMYAAKTAMKQGASL